MKARREKPIKLSSSTKISSISPWSLALNAFFYGIVFGIIANVVVAGAWEALNRAGIFTRLDSMVIGVAGEDATLLSPYVTFDKVMTISLIATAAFIGAVPLFALISGVIYNAISRFTGGIRITMTSKVFKNVVEEARALEDETVALPVVTKNPGRRRARKKEKISPQGEILSDTKVEEKSPVVIAPEDEIEPINSEEAPAALPPVGELTVDEQKRLNRILSSKQ